MGSIFALHEHLFREKFGAGKYCSRQGLQDNKRGKEEGYDFSAFQTLFLKRKLLPCESALVQPQGRWRSSTASRQCSFHQCLGKIFCAEDSNNPRAAWNRWGWFTSGNCYSVRCCCWLCATFPAFTMLSDSDAILLIQNSTLKSCPLDPVPSILVSKC